MPAGVGTNDSDRRWRVSLTLVAWMLLVQSALAALAGVAELIIRPTLLPVEPMIFAGEVTVADIAEVLRYAVLLSRLSLLLNAVLFVGSIGLLGRQKWGWYTVVLVHVVGIAVLFVLVPPMFGGLIAVFGTGGFGLLPWISALILALAPGAVIAFLLLGGIVRQFDTGSAGSAAPAG